MLYKQRTNGTAHIKYFLSCHTASKKYQYEFTSGVSNKEFKNGSLEDVSFIDTGVQRYLGREEVHKINVFVNSLCEIAMHKKPSWVRHLFRHLLSWLAWFVFNHFCKQGDEFSFQVVNFTSNQLSLKMLTISRLIK